MASWLQGARPWIGPVLLGGFGGALPAALKIGTSIVTDPDQPLPNPHIILGMAIFFVIGIFANIAFNKERDFRSAVIIGIAAPGLITNIIAGAKDAPDAKTETENHAAANDERPVVRWVLTSGFIGTAYAGSNDPQCKLPEGQATSISQTLADLKEKTVVISVDPGDTRPRSDYHGTVFGLSDKQQVSENFVRPYSHTETYFKSSVDAARLEFFGTTINLPLWPDHQPASFLVVVRLAAAARWEDDVWWSLGADRKLTPYAQDVCIYRATPNNMVLESAYHQSRPRNVEVDLPLGDVTR
jgi:hypothetical protein